MPGRADTTCYSTAGICYLCAHGTVPETAAGRIHPGTQRERHSEHSSSSDNDNTEHGKQHAEQASIPSTGTHKKSIISHNHAPATEFSAAYMHAHAHSEAAGNKTQNPSQPSTPSPCEKVCRRLWQPLQRTTAGLVQSAATMPKYHLRKRISGGERANANKSGEDKQERAGRSERPSQLKYARQRLACATLGSSRNM